MTECTRNCDCVGPCKLGADDVCRNIVTHAQDRRRALGIGGGAGVIDLGDGGRLLNATVRGEVTVIAKHPEQVSGCCFIGKSVQQADGVKLSATLDDASAAHGGRGMTLQECMDAEGGPVSIVVPIGECSETDLIAALDSLVSQWGTHNCTQAGDDAKARAVGWLHSKYGATP